MTGISRFLRFFLRKNRPAKAECLVFGIGNPGVGYRNTRHNAGFMTVDGLSGFLTDAHTMRSPLFTASWGMLAGKKTALVKPTTFVNACGPSFVASTAAFGVAMESALVVVDDFHLSLGAVRLRRGGSDGGHNGLASIIERCGEDFARLRVGIGPLPAGARQVDFVLGDFDEEEEPARGDAVRTACEAAIMFCTNGIERAMNRFNNSRRENRGDR